MADTKGQKGWIVTLVGYVLGAGIAVATTIRRSKRSKGGSKGGARGAKGGMHGHGHGGGPPVGKGHHGEQRGDAPGQLAARLAAMGDEEWFPPPMPKGDLTVAELKTHDGSDGGKPILLAAKGTIYDVTRGRDFYGPEGAYHIFAGVDCSRALATMSLKIEDCVGDVSDATEEDLSVLNDWVVKFQGKYPAVGKLLDGDYNGPR